MDGHVAFLYAAVVLQLFLAADQVRSLMLATGDAISNLHTLSTDVIGLISTLLTAVYGYRLRRIRHSLVSVERSLPIDIGDDCGGGGRSVPEYRNRVWLAVAVAAFGYLKYGQLMRSDGEEHDAFEAAVAASLCTASMAGNYYVTVMFMDHVLLTKRVLYKLNALIMDTLGSVSASFLAGFTVSSARLAYLDICDGCATVTRTFQTQLFVNIVGNMFSVTFMTLSAFNTLMSDGTNTIRITLYFLYDSLMRTLQMYFIIDACHTTVEQVQLFILEMLDHKIEFVIYGFICLDFEMFVSVPTYVINRIMGTIATYLLILVQLGSSPNILENTNATTLPYMNTKIPQNGFTAT